MGGFHSLYTHGFFRTGSCVPRMGVGDPQFNLERTLELAQRAHAHHVGLVVFPELGLSGYAIDDLLLQQPLLDAVEQAIFALTEASEALFPVLVVGAPLRWQGRLYNCAVVIHRGEILGVVPKSFLPNYREFYEARHFSSGIDIADAAIEVAGQEAPFGTDLLFRSAGSAPVTFHVEICEDVWTAVPPSSFAALAGAEILVNLSASNITIGKADTRRLLCGSQSARTISAYVYSAAGPGESTTDLAWDGHAAIFEYGELLAESARFPDDSVLITADIDLGRLRQERLRITTFGDSARAEAARVSAFQAIAFHIDAPDEDVPLQRLIERFPYVPSDPLRLREDCYEAFSIQVQGLAQRMRVTGSAKLVIGVSGGLDSTHALLVCARVMDSLGKPRSDILAYTMPGFATSEDTKSKAWALMRALGVSAAELDIRPAARQMLSDLGHPAGAGEAVYDVTFENVQAGLRTDYLFRLANHHHGMVVGTGDLSELGLGWCTYGVGDHMSHYNPNASVSKTLIQHLIRFVANSGDVDADTASLLEDILAQEISPELVPADANGAIQSTEAKVGPYALQDFNLFYVTRYGFAPSKIAFMALHAWGDVERGRWPANISDRDRRAYTLTDIRHWLEVFVFRFFAISQFKRSAVPNGPKISSGGSLSPRGDWRAPSDGNAKVWLDELKRNTPEA